MAMRILAVMAAVFLVGAFALATLGPPDMPLGNALFVIDHGLLRTAQQAVQNHLGVWTWGHLVVPLLIRPVWLVPAALGLVCAGGALTLASGAPHSRRRRS